MNNDHLSMRQLLFDPFCGLIVQHGDGLLSGMQIHAYNFISVLFRKSVVRAPTFYSARCQADLVMVQQR
jgi:hypothetical protein